MTIVKQSPSQSFFMLTPNVRDSLLEAKLTAAEWRIWCYLVSLDPFGDRGAKYSPAELMLKCGVKKTTYFAAKAKFQKLGIFEFRDGTTKVFNLQGYAVHPDLKEDSQQASLIESEISDYSQQAPLIGSEISESEFGISESEFGISESQSEISESKSPEPLSNGGFSSPQTIQKFQTNQTRGGKKFFSQQSQINDKGQDEANQLEEEVRQGEELKEENGLEIIASVIEKVPRAVSADRQAVVRKTTKAIQAPQIPQDLINKLEELEIPLDDRVIGAIASHHLSQAYGAVAHIENTWESINNPRGVFLFQLPRQPVEVMGTRVRVKTARDFDFTLTDIKRMYGTNWRDAAVHFGIDIPEEDKP